MSRWISGEDLTVVIFLIGLVVCIAACFAVPVLLAKLIVGLL